MFLRAIRRWKDGTVENLLRSGSCDPRSFDIYEPLTASTALLSISSRSESSSLEDVSRSLFSDRSLAAAFSFSFSERFLCWNVPPAGAVVGLVGAFRASESGTYTPRRLGKPQNLCEGPSYSH